MFHNRFRKFTWSPEQREEALNRLPRSVKPEDLGPALKALEKKQKEENLRVADFLVSKAENIIVGLSLDEKEEYDELVKKFFILQTEQWFRRGKNYYAKGEISRAFLNLEMGLASAHGNIEVPQEYIDFYNKVDNEHTNMLIEMTFS